MEFFTIMVASGIIYNFSYFKRKVETSYGSYKDGYGIFEFREGYPY